MLSPSHVNVFFLLRMKIRSTRYNAQRNTKTYNLFEKLTTFDNRKLRKRRKMENEDNQSEQLIQSNKRCPCLLKFREALCKERKIFVSVLCDISNLKGDFI